MNTDKSLLTRLSETFDEYRADRRRAQAQDSRPQPARLHRFLRWLTPNGGTLLLMAVLLLTQNAWARQSTSPIAPGPSANTVNYQGRLANPDGTPVADNTYAMSFSLWDAPTDGNLVWGAEDHAVPVSGGLFSVGLGSKNPIPTTTWNGDRYLEITVGGETLSPRELIRSVPIAGMALTVPDGAIGAAQIASGAVTNIHTVVIGPEAGIPETTSTAFTDIPGYEIVMETTGNPVLLMFQGTFKGQADSGIALDFTVDGIRVSQGAVHGINRVTSPFSEAAEPGTMIWVVTPSPGLHTFRVQWRSMGDGPRIRLNQDQYAVQFVAIEFKR